MKPDLVKKIEKLNNGFKLNNSVTVFNISWGESAPDKKLEKIVDAEYDIEYDEKEMTAEAAIALCEHFFSDVVVQYLAGEFKDAPPKVVAKKLRSPGI